VGGEAEISIPLSIGFLDERGGRNFGVAEFAVGVVIEEHRHTIYELPWRAQLP
jgi:hypothetical protein